MSDLDYQAPSGYTQLEVIEDGNVTYIVNAIIGDTRADAMLSVKRITTTSTGVRIAYADCKYLDIKTATYKGLA